MVLTTYKLSTPFFFFGILGCHIRKKDYHCLGTTSSTTTGRSASSSSITAGSTTRKPAVPTINSNRDTRGFSRPQVNVVSLFLFHSSSYSLFLFFSHFLSLSLYVSLPLSLDTKYMSLSCCSFSCFRGYLVGEGGGTLNKIARNIPLLTHF